jgi:large subunit ribosomal protein L4
MTKVLYQLVDSGGTEVGAVELSGRVFAGPKSQVAVHSTVVWQLSKRRAGTHSALERSAMKGGGKKPFRQKGTGRARAGSSVSPLWVGGAVVHGPRPRLYEKGLNKKVRAAALSSVLTDLVDSKRLTLVDSLASCQGKARQGALLLKGVGCLGTTLIVLTADEAHCALSFRNLKGVTVLTVAGLNVYDVVRSKHVVMSQAAAQAVASGLEKRLGVRSEVLSNVGQ